MHPGCGGLAVVQLLGVHGACRQEDAPHQHGSEAILGDGKTEAWQVCLYHGMGMHLMKYLTCSSPPLSDLDESG